MSILKKELKIFVISKERIPVGPPNPAIFEIISGETTDALKRNALRHLGELGKVRSLNFSPTGLVGYVEEQ